MKEPQRLIDGAGDELEIALLASAAEDDGPSAAAMGRMLVALGIGGGLGVAGAAAAAPTASGAAAAAAGKGAAAAAAGKGAVLAAAGQGTVAVLAKWAVIAAVGGIGTWGIVEHLIASDGPPSGPSAAVLAPGTAPMRAPGTGLAVQVPRSGAAKPLAAQPQGDTTDLGAPRDARAETQRTSSGPARAPTPQAVPTLAAEVEALDRAQAEIEADPEATLRRLDEYESGYRDGSLGPEAQVLRIEALARAGKIEQARALGHAFLAHHPASPHAQRVRSILAAPASAGE